MRFFILIIIFTLLYSPICIAKELYKAEVKVSQSTNINDVLSGLEKQVYSKNYDFEDIPTRIERLENSIYGKKSQGALLGRVDRLSNSINASKSRQSDFKNKVMIELLENRYFNTLFKKDKIEDRLTRLEKVILGRAFVGNTEYRLNNLMSKVPMNIVGVTVSDSSGNKASIRPELSNSRQYSALDDLEYATSEGNYFDNIRKQRDDKVQRWGDFPVYIYIAKTRDQKKMQAAQKAIENWSKHIQLALINNDKDANIIINWDENGNNVIESTLISNSNRTSYQALIQAGYYKHPDTLEKYLMHEIGHSIGLWGHSDDPADIMYNFKETNPNMTNCSKGPKCVSINTAPQEPSKRDINTLIRIYNSPGN
ncbi:MAG: hypothetical protein ACD_20C00085G0032 [uncultured bacterium]|nr:MAG: hypothetical protein ACD_20C00085G0032 [uncultured bacterium]HBH17675.1 hypothetical protein [Cyanobacteria bacterium UBA9579]